MKIITDKKEIEAAYARIENSEGAFATCRCLPGQWEQDNCQEWCEPVTIEGAPANVYYMFENKECESEYAEDLLWDAEHVSKIEVAEKDEAGKYESL